MSEITGTHIHITGIVQGVGFRPFVYGLAERYALTGWVRNTSAGVDIEIDGTTISIQEFTNALTRETPPLARIDELEIIPGDANGFSRFEIVHSEAIDTAFQPISPDVCLCIECLHELFDPGDRRYRYPFINCTNCGPRFTIIEDIPYDRPKTTMASFELCKECAAEYDDPLNRRFHAQPVACPQCGPTIWLELSKLRYSTSEERAINNPVYGDSALSESLNLLSDGKIIAIKGLGGFHLACNAKNQEAVAELRRRKLRVDKPFAVMMPDIDTIEAHCYVSPAERELLLSRQRPIVILKRKVGSDIVRDIAPRQNTLGAMLPYTPLHYLLFPDHFYQTDDIINKHITKPLDVLVMTSGNLSEEPIAANNNEARERLSDLVDAFLMHNRPIRTRCDDSVVRVFSGTTIDKKNVSKQDEVESRQHNGLTYPLRRSRGYTPFPVYLPWETPPLLATGAELKNTFCITRGKYAFLSHHIGDMENYETLRSFEDGIKHFERLFRIKPEAIAYDTHPDYLASRYALQRAEQEMIPSIGVQHHHAHITSCMAEHNIPTGTPVIGVAFDGTGYGDDRAVWGGEFILSDYFSYTRYAHLAYVPLPGGNLAIRTPSRMALAYLWQYGLDWDDILQPVQSFNTTERSALRSQLEHNINSPPTSSMGRLFDAVAALAGVRQKVNYEAQAAIEFEALATDDEQTYYPFDIKGNQPPSPIQGQENLRPPEKIINAEPLLRELVTDIKNETPINRISTRFHAGVSEMVKSVCHEMRNQFGTNIVALSGGVWQNMVLLTKTVSLLEVNDFQVLIHTQIPANDGGLSLGQAAIAIHRLQN